MVELTPSFAGGSLMWIPVREILRAYIAMVSYQSYLSLKYVGSSVLSGKVVWWREKSHVLLTKIPLQQLRC